MRACAHEHYCCTCVIIHVTIINLHMVIDSIVNQCSLIFTVIYSLPVMKTLVPYTREEKMDTVAVVVGMEVKDEIIQS